MNNLSTLNCAASLSGGILTLENGQTINLDAIEAVLWEFRRCMGYMADHDNLPDDTCPDDLYNYAWERMNEIEGIE